MEKKPQFLTQEGIKRFEEELELLTKVRMEDVKIKLQEARAQGDLSENAEYEAAREEQAEVYARIQELQYILKNAVIIETDENSDVVRMGTTVTYREESSGEEFTFKIVGTAEANPFEGKISNDSPLAKSLDGKRAGERATVTTPKGMVDVTISMVQ